MQLHRPRATPDAAPLVPAHAFALALALALAGCGSSHGIDGPTDGGGTDARADTGRDSGGGGGGCGGTAPPCYDGWSGSPGCCLEGTARPATCVGRDFTCPPGAFLEDACARVDPICEGPNPDAGGPPSYFSCGATSDCVLRADSCCGTCGVPTASDVVAVRADRAEDYYVDVSCPEAASGPVPCPACVAQPNPSLVATCAPDASGALACAVLDVAADPVLAGCTADDECVLRVPGCCECGADTSPFSLIALRADRVTDFVGRVCDPDSACDDCAPIYPSGVAAICEAGLCRVATGG